MNENVFSSMEDAPLTKLFLETSPRAKKKTTLSWMSEISDEDLQAISNVADKMEHAPEDYEGNDIVDFVSMSWCVASFETSMPIETISDKVLEECVVNVGLLATLESLRRKSILSIEGEGMATNIKTTNAVATEMGQMLADGIKTVHQISILMKEQMDEKSK